MTRLLGERQRHRERAWGVRRAATAIACVGLWMAGTASAENLMWVTATAYNSVPEQTDDTPWIAAWGDTLAPGMKVIAVSRDLLDEGLTRGVRVKVEGLPGEYVVLDKMNRRFTERIDLYMGDDIEAARRWGTRNVVIRWVGR